MSDSKLESDEFEQLKRLARQTTDAMLNAMAPENPHRATFEKLRWMFEQGYVAGAQDVLKTVQDGATELRTGFAKAHLQAAIRAKLGL